MRSRGHHPGELTLRAYALRSYLSPALHTRLAEHLSGCSACRQAVDETRSDFRLVAGFSVFELPPPFGGRVFPTRPPGALVRRDYAERVKGVLRLKAATWFAALPRAEQAARLPHPERDAKLWEDVRRDLHDFERQFAELMGQAGPEGGDDG